MNAQQLAKIANSSGLDLVVPNDFSWHRQNGAVNSAPDKLGRTWSQIPNGALPVGGAESGWTRFSSGRQSSPVPNPFTAPKTGSGSPGDALGTGLYDPQK